ncbi:hypothetical protein HDV00_012753, partial [Rhizophlyctis rosea]
FISVWDVGSRKKTHILHADFMSLWAALRIRKYAHEDSYVRETANQLATRHEPYYSSTTPPLPEHHLWTIETLSANDTSSTIVCNYGLRPIYLVFYAGEEYAYYRRSPSSSFSSAESAESMGGNMMMNVSILGASPVGNGRLVRLIDAGVSSVPQPLRWNGGTGSASWNTALHIPKCVLVGRIAFVTTTSATSSDPPHARVSAFDTRSGKRLPPLTYTGAGLSSITDLSVSGDGRRVFACGVGGVVVCWDVGGALGDEGKENQSGPEGKGKGVEVGQGRREGRVWSPGWGERRSWIV